MVSAEQTGDKGPVPLSANFHEWGGARELEGWREGGAGGLRAEGGFGEIDD